MLVEGIICILFEIVFHGLNLAVSVDREPGLKPKLHSDILQKAYFAFNLLDYHIFLFLCKYQKIGVEYRLGTGICHTRSVTKKAYF